MKEKSPQDLKIQPGNMSSIIVLGWICFVVAQCADLETQCNSFTDGKLSVATATVNGNTVNGTGCTAGSLTSVQFRFTNKTTNTVESVEIAPYDPTTGTCNTAWNGDARCASKDPSTNLFTFEVKFTADRATHSQQYLTIATSCVPTGAPTSPYTVDYSRCDPIPVVDATTTTTSTATTNSGTTSDTSPTSTDSNKDTTPPDDNTALLVGIIVGVVAVVAVAIVIGIYCFVFRKKRKCIFVDPQKRYQPDKLKKVLDNIEKEVGGIKAETRRDGKVEIDVYRTLQEPHVLINSTNIIALNEAARKVEELIDRLIREICGGHRKRIKVDPQKKCQPDELKQILDNIQKEIEGIKTETNGEGKVDIMVFRGPEEPYVFIEGADTTPLNNAVEKVEKLVDRLIQETCGSGRRGNKVADHHVGTNGDK